MSLPREATPKIQKHCQSYHGWVNSHGAGRPGPKRKRELASAPQGSPALPWRENVACQRFFRSRNASGWFEVERKSLPVWASKMYTPDARKLSPIPLSTSRPKKRAAIQAVKQHVEAVLQRHEQHMQAQNQPRVYAMGLGEDSLAATSPWLERTQWQVMYRNVRRDILKAMTANATTRVAFSDCCSLSMPCRLGRSLTLVFLSGHGRISSPFKW